jgi:hypothetical protein
MALGHEIRGGSERAYRRVDLLERRRELMRLLELTRLPASALSANEGYRASSCRRVDGGGRAQPLTAGAQSMIARRAVGVA